MIKVLIFDLDGTLVDTMEVYAEKAAELISFYHKIPFEEAKKNYLDTSGLPFCEQLEILFPDSPLNSKIVQEFETWKATILDRFKKLPEEKRKVLNNLRKKYKIVVASNNLESYVKRLTSNWPIDMALGFDGKNFKKGAPQFEWIQKYYQVEKLEMVFIGDSLKDAELAKTYGIPFIGISKFFSSEKFRKIYPACLVIKNFKELTKLLL